MSIIVEKESLEKCQNLKKCGHVANHCSITKVTIIVTNNPFRGLKPIFRVALAKMASFWSHMEMGPNLTN
jgi:hypothetical protein